MDQFLLVFKVKILLIFILLMDRFIVELSNYYNWLSIYCEYVVFEYERFLVIANNNRHLYLIPSEDIEKCWQYHVLYMEFYNDYCMKRFQRLIIYKPLKTDNNAHVNKILECRQLYFKKFGNAKYEMVWNRMSIKQISKHTDKNIFYLFILNEQYSYSPIIGETILTLKEMAGKKLNLNKDKIQIHIDDEQCHFNLQQLYRIYNYRYEKGYGSKNNLSLPDKISLLDLLFYNYNKLHIGI